MTRHAVLASCLVALVFGLSEGARAEGNARLVYLRGSAAEACPDESGLRAAVQARLGSDPFDIAGAQTFRVEIEREAEGLVGRVILIDERQGSQRTRRFEGNCEDLVQAIALAISLAINPALAFEPNASDAGSGPALEAIPPASARPGTKLPEPAERSRPSRPSQPPPPVRQRASAARSPPPAEPQSSSSSRLRWGAGALLHGALGTLPEPAAGFDWFARARLRSLSFSVEGRFERALEHELPTGGRVDSSLLAAALVPCAHLSWFAGCALGLFGSVRAESKAVPDRRSDAVRYAAVGGRASAEGRLGRTFSLLARMDALVAVTPIEVLRNQDVIWSAPPVSVTLGAGALFEIP